jgi:hypothetical protein
VTYFVRRAQRLLLSIKTEVTGTSANQGRAGKAGSGCLRTDVKTGIGGCVYDVKGVTGAGLEDFGLGSL